jgi:hypothetical protein
MEASQPAGRQHMELLVLSPHAVKAPAAVGRWQWCNPRSS